MSKYLFRRKGEYIGELMCKNDSQAFTMANDFGATFIKNIDNKIIFGKCSKCGEWEKIERLKNCLCSDCAYVQEIEFFVEHMENSMVRALEEDEKGNEELYHQFMNEPIRISFNGASIELVTGPCEWEHIIQSLLNIAKEYPW